MEPLTAMRVGHIRSLAGELDKYADEHMQAGDDERGLAAAAASEKLGDYASALEAPDAPLDD